MPLRRHPGALGAPEVARLEVTAEGLAAVLGLSRQRIGQLVAEGTRGYVPVSVIDKPAENRMASTVRHNRARGEHGVEAMSNIVAQMREAGWTDAKIGRAMGMSADEVLRLQQITGLAALFAGQDFSRSWEIEDVAGNDDADGRAAA